MGEPLGIGSTVWMRDPNKRGTYREKWVEAEVRAETSRSWIVVRKGWARNEEDVQRLGVKLPKKATAEDARRLGLSLSIQAIEEEAWLQEHRWRVARLVENADVATLRKVAELVGYKEGA